MTPGSVASLIDLLNEKGGAAYFGEPVSQLEHSLQAAHRAEVAGAGDVQITAALLHDIGHMLHGMEEDIAAHGLNARHEEIAADYLAQWFGEEVTLPIRLHVPAKRFLCWHDPRYLEQLSPASIESLALQGGPMNDQQAALFLNTPFAHQAIALRKWDDEAKVPGLRVPAADYYLPLLRATASAHPAA